MQEAAMTPAEVADLRRWLEASEGLADGQPFLGDRRLDAITDVLLELAAQLWVSRRRNAVLEELLSERGIIGAQDIEKYVFSESQAAELRSARELFVATIFRSLSQLPQTPLPEGDQEI
jgi:hypothetical protein